MPTGKWINFYPPSRNIKLHFLCSGLEMYVEWPLQICLLSTKYLIKRFRRLFNFQSLQFCVYFRWNFTESVSTTFRRTGRKYKLKCWLQRLLLPNFFQSFPLFFILCKVLESIEMKGSHSDQSPSPL